MHALTLAVTLASPHAHRPRPADHGCTVTANPLAFLPYDASSARPSDGAGSISFSCNQNVTISLSAGAGTYAQREMVGNGREKLAYNIYTDFTYATIWGDGTQGTATVALNTAKEPLVPVPGRIPPKQTVSAGTYTDSISITIAF